MMEQVKAYKFIGDKCPRCFKMFKPEHLVLDPMRGGMVCAVCMSALEEFYKRTSEVKS